MFIFVVISGVLIEPTGLDAEIDQLVVDFSAAQIFDGVGGAVVGLRQKQHFSFDTFGAGEKAGGVANRFLIMVSTTCVNDIF